ncbi:YaaR family protein [Breznakiella homolactica]|uniref:DUF327 family protein n=1 Tax=Breznakiella homolactica TaxID=2798577 RepID=A0A7T7XP25_9SPIR|nr:DUF327 family protein [Breznakiella homolactica]QQO09881.1 DUF327 family protein [Breznakiella homolactica]
MAKVDFPDSSSPFFNPALYNTVKPEAKKSKEKDDVRGVKKPRFSAILDEAAGETASAGEIRDLSPSEETLRELLDGVHSAGDELRQRPFPEEIKKYKQAVRNFLHYIVENGYTVEEQTSGTNLLKRKKFTLVQVADRKLEQLAASIMAGQNSQLEILARLDEIAGILVDLLQ